MVYYFILFQNWGNMTRKKATNFKTCSLYVHYILFKQKMTLQDKTFAFVNHMYEYVLIYVVYVHANKDLFIEKITMAIIESQRRRYTHYSMKT